MTFEQIAGHVMTAILAAAELPPGGQAAAPTGQAAAPTTSDPFSILYFMLPMVLVMWFFMFRPNQKREKERQTMLGGLAKGDKVVTSSGIIGNIVGVSEKTVVLRVSEEPPVKMEFLRASVSRVIPRDEKEK